MKSHCPKGHEYSPENTYTYEFTRPGFDRVYTSRICKTCCKARNEVRNARHKAALEIVAAIEAGQR